MSKQQFDHSGLSRLKLDNLAIYPSDYTTTASNGVVIDWANIDFQTIGNPGRRVWQMQGSGYTSSAAFSITYTVATPYTIGFEGPASGTISTESSGVLNANTTTRLQSGSGDNSTTITINFRLKEGNQRFGYAVLKNDSEGVNFYPQALLYNGSCWFAGLQTNSTSTTNLISSSTGDQWSAVGGSNKPTFSDGSYEIDILGWQSSISTLLARFKYPAGTYFYDITSTSWSNSGLNSTVCGLACNPETCVASTENGYYYLEITGTTDTTTSWEMISGLQSLDTTSTAISYNGTYWVIIAKANVAYATDPSSDWTITNHVSGTSDVYGIAYNGTNWVSIGSKGLYYTSQSNAAGNWKLSWQNVPFIGFNPYHQNLITWNGTYFFASGFTGIIKSETGEPGSWSGVYDNIGVNHYVIASDYNLSEKSGGNNIVVMWNSGSLQIAYSTDGGMTWNSGSYS